MTTQYGFFIDSSRCTGCKTCELACKDYKNLTPEVSFRRIYEYAGGDWQEDNGVWQQNVFAYYRSIACCRKAMFDFLENSAFFGVAISVVSYGIGMLLKKKFKLAILNPLLISIVITIAFLALTGISYEKYDEGAKYLNYLLTPATVCLAIPLYEQLELLKHNWRAVLLGILSGVLSSLGVILGMALMFELQ